MGSRNIASNNLVTATRIMRSRNMLSRKTLSPATFSRNTPSPNTCSRSTRSLRSVAMCIATPMATRISASAVLFFPISASFAFTIAGAPVSVDLPVVNRYEGNIFSGEKRMELLVVPALTVQRDARHRDRSDRRAWAGAHGREGPERACAAR